MSWQYKKGLHDLGNNTWAWLQPDGTWGWSNAGLIVDGEASLLVDTLFDEKLTAEMLKAMRAASPAASDIEVVVNTHANGDHCYGNGLVGEAEIISSKASAEEMNELPPAYLSTMMKNAPQMGAVGKYLLQCFGAFDFDRITFKPPTKTFTGSMELTVGDKEVHLMEVGPAHTRGDVLVYVPQDGVVFTGDILFIDGTPIMWAGPIENWIDACHKIVALDVSCVVPGHGPITDKAGVDRVRHYLEYIRIEARKRYDAGQSVFEAALDISLDGFASLTDAERIAVNVDTLYRQFSGDQTPPNILDLFTIMAKIAEAR